ncbi:hypothetical protein O0882_12430 [Janthinobacterium sp. SUN073]|uniref:hypothetical protein n=1 Tax=Janthinobacterium sp. SUN073 TaxID=3004102 RepID=UPI0025B04E6E|nr:hypothetical protein [Janthinobacterium sp. SUN073]MDN2697123.1 hypothetical protein [Janthinobacterium sp. SUN073]
MSLASLLSDFSDHLQSDQFRLTARHPDHPTAFQRRRKLPLPSFVALMLTGMRKSVQTELDEFFGHLQQQAQLTHQVSAQAFAQARSKLATTAMPELTTGSLLKHSSMATCRAGTVSGWSPLTPRPFALACAPAMSNVPP